MECGCDAGKADVGPENTDEAERRKVAQVEKKRRVDESAGDAVIHRIEFAPLFGEHEDFGRALVGMNGQHAVVSSAPEAIVVSTADPDGLMRDAARLSHYYGVQHTVSRGDQVPSGGAGYHPPDDPQIIPGKPGEKAAFFQKHMPEAGAPRFTDVDKSTLDDDLFNAKNIDRAELRKRAAGSVYEGVLERLGLVEDTTGSEMNMLRVYGIKTMPHLSYAMNLVSQGMSHAQAAAETIRKFNLGGMG